MPEILTSSAQTIDPRVCPLCGDLNRCANEVERETGIPQGACWCTTTIFDPALLERIPAQARRLACVCARCAAQPNQPLPKD